MQYHLISPEKIMLNNGGDINFKGHMFVLWKMIIQIKKGASDEHYCVSLQLKHYSHRKLDWLKPFGDLLPGIIKKKST